ncbi:MAG: PadR family transcriptional regulator [Candidatus Hydrogenedentes bacterium]|nr:PadR family transcriptional regulator [Candidatus Hydrogenedentota bacterium]
MHLKGTLPILILQVLERGPSHGYAIAQDIKQRSKGVLDFREGTLYPALHSQEAKGFIEASQRVEQGRTRRYYQLTQKGRKALAKEKREWQESSNAINLILGEALGHG